MSLAGPTGIVCAVKVCEYCGQRVRDDLDVGEMAFCEIGQKLARVTVKRLPNWKHGRLRDDGRGDR